MVNQSPPTPSTPSTPSSEDSGDVPSPTLPLEPARRPAAGSSGTKRPVEDVEDVEDVDDADAGPSSEPANKKPKVSDDDADAAGGDEEVIEGDEISNDTMSGEGPDEEVGGEDQAADDLAGREGQEEELEEEEGDTSPEDITRGAKPPMGGGDIAGGPGRRVRLWYTDPETKKPVQTNQWYNLDSRTEGAPQQDPATAIHFTQFMSRVMHNVATRAVGFSQSGITSNPVTLAMSLNQRAWQPLQDHIDRFRRGFGLHPGQIPKADALFRDKDDSGDDDHNGCICGGDGSCNAGRAVEDDEYENGSTQDGDDDREPDSEDDGETDHNSNDEDDDDDGVVEAGNGIQAAQVTSSGKAPDRAPREPPATAEDVFPSQTGVNATTAAALATVPTPQPGRKSKTAAPQASPSNTTTAASAAPARQPKAVNPKSPAYRDVPYREAPADAVCCCNPAGGHGGNPGRLTHCQNEATCGNWAHSGKRCGNMWDKGSTLKAWWCPACSGVEFGSLTNPNQPQPPPPPPGPPSGGPLGGPPPPPPLPGAGAA